MKDVITCGKLWNYFTWCTWGGTVTRAEYAWDQLQKIKNNNKLIYFLGTVFAPFCGI